VPGKQHVARLQAAGPRTHAAGARGVLGEDVVAATAPGAGDPGRRGPREALRRHGARPLAQSEQRPAGKPPRKSRTGNHDRGVNSAEPNRQRQKQHRCGPAVGRGRGGQPDSNLRPAPRVRHPAGRVSGSDRSSAAKAGRSNRAGKKNRATPVRTTACQRKRQGRTSKHAITGRALSQRNRISRETGTSSSTSQPRAQHPPAWPTWS